MKRKAAACMMLILGGLVLQPALAAPEDRREEREQRREQQQQQHPGRSFGPNEAAKRAQARNGGGRVLNVKPVDQGYNVKLLKQGEVRVLTVPDNNNPQP